MGPWWLTWHLCLYICEKCEMSRLWHTNEQWKVEQYSVWAESAINWMIWSKGWLLYLRNGSTSFGHFRQQPLCTHMWRKAGLTTFYFWFNNGFHGHIFFSSWKVQAFLQPIKNCIKYFLEWPSHINCIAIRNFINMLVLHNKIICIFFWIQNGSFVSCLVKPSRVSWTLD